MLTHIVCWKYKDEISGARRREHRERLKNLKNIISEIIDLKVGADVLHLARSFDTGIVATFKNLEDLDVYTVHPAHQEVAKLGKEVAAQVVSVDFISEQ